MSPKTEDPHRRALVRAGRLW